MSYSKSIDFEFEDSQRQSFSSDKENSQPQSVQIIDVIDVCTKLCFKFVHNFVNCHILSF